MCFTPGMTGCVAGQRQGSAQQRAAELGFVTGSDCWQRSLAAAVTDGG